MANSQMDQLLESIGSMIDAKLQAAGVGAQAEAPKAAPAKATGTASKAATLVRNLDPVDVDTGTEGLLFRVQAANGGGILTNGSRVVPITVDANGKERICRSLTAGMVDALGSADVRKAVKAAIDTVDKRAHIGAHKPTVQAAS